MPFDGSGNYTPAAVPNFPAVGGSVISSTYYNNVINDIATALSNTLTRDGQGKPSVDLNWNGKSLTNVNNLDAVTASFSGLLTANGSIAIPAAGGVRSTVTNGSVDISGGSSFNTNGASIGLQGSTAAFNAFGMEFYAGGSERMRLDTNGNLGLGLTPTYRFDVYGAGVSGDLGRITSSGTQSGLILGDTVSAVRVGSRSGDFIADVGGSERLRVDTAGNVGIGVSTISYGKLQVDGSTSAFNYYVSGSGTTDAGSFGFSNANGPNIQFWGSATVAPGATIFLAAGYEKMRLDGSGRLGIGTAPGSSLLLDVNDAGRFVANASNGVGVIVRGRSSDDYASFQITNNAGSIEQGVIIHNATDMYLQNSRNGALVFRTNATDRGYWTSAGDFVHLGATFFVNTNKALIQHDGTNGYFRSQTGSCFFGANGANYFQISSGGVLSEVVSGNELGYKDLPQNAQAAGYTLVITDRGKHIYCTGGAAAVTIPPDSSVAFPIGTTCTVINDGSGARTLTQGAGVVLKWAGTGATGNRTLAVGGMATLIKVGTDTWYVSGSGLS